MHLKSPKPIIQHWIPPFPCGGAKTLADIVAEVSNNGKWSQAIDLSLVLRKRMLLIRGACRAQPLRVGNLLRAMTWLWLAHQERKARKSIWMLLMHKWWSHWKKQGNNCLLLRMCHRFRRSQSKKSKQKRSPERRDLAQSKGRSKARNLTHSSLLSSFSPRAMKWEGRSLLVSTSCSVVKRFPLRVSGRLLREQYAWLRFWKKDQERLSFRLLPFWKKREPRKSQTPPSRKARMKSNYLLDTLAESLFDYLTTLLLTQKLTGSKSLSLSKLMISHQRMKLSKA